MLEQEMQLGELKSRYVAMAAHDLRNPLAAIQTAIDVFAKYSDRLTEDQKQSRYDRIRGSIQVMVAMLDDILTIGQVESGRLKFNPAPLELISFCQNLVAEIRQVTHAPQVIDFSYQGDFVMVAMDAKLLRHILANLLSNAIKYSPDEGAIVFTVSCEHDETIFFVQDQVIGIPQADQARLFEAFHRADNVGNIPGTGLGLAIVKQSVDLHGGTITFTSTEGLGTKFTVTIPQPPQSN
ncbi:MAG: HAMP domain-containing histidine kinase, partial [Chloroflexi bacterium]|nr:HAMP domain-containing histidine kinase [Chloroflexota bacterium]